MPTDIHVHRWGDWPPLDSSPPLLLLHGISDDGACWTSLAEQLAAAGWSVAAPDARGHGRTPLPPGERVSLATLADDAASVLDDLGVPAVVIGHSMGAMTGAALAAAPPVGVLALVLEDPPWGRDRAADLGLDELSRPVREMQALDHAGRMRRGRLENPSWPEPELVHWAEAKAAVDLALYDQWDVPASLSWKGVVDRIGCPVLLVTGDQGNGAILDSDLAGELATRPGWRLVRVPGAGHCVRRDAPDAFTAALDDALRPYG